MFGRSFFSADHEIRGKANAAVESPNAFKKPRRVNSQLVDFLSLFVRSVSSIFLLPFRICLDPVRKLCFIFLQYIKSVPETQALRRSRRKDWKCFIALIMM
jgi:hypothetical protein